MRPQQTRAQRSSQSRKTGSSRVEASPHVQVLRALAGEQKHDRRVVGAAACRVKPRGVLGAVRARSTASGDVLATTIRRCRNALRPTWHVKATSASRRLGILAEMSGEPGRRVLEGGLRFGGQRDRAGSGVVPGRAASGASSSIDVGVGAADSQRSHACAARRTVCCRQSVSDAVDIERTILRSRSADWTAGS